MSVFDFDFAHAMVSFSQIEIIDDIFILQKNLNISKEISNNFHDKQHLSKYYWQ